MSSDEEPKSILDDKVMMYIYDNYEEIGVPRPVLYSVKPCYDAWGNEDVSEPLTLDFVEYYTRFNDVTPPMWLRIILRYFDQNEIHHDVKEYLYSSLNHETSFWYFINGVTKHSRPDFWHQFFPEILKLLKKHGLKIPKDGAMIELMREIVQ